MMDEHRCHAAGCEVEIPPSLLMCNRHWRLVPRDLQRAVWRYYRKGQEVDKQPSQEYMEAQRQAVAFVAMAERNLMRNERR